jgi:hypothetical protein
MGRTCTTSASARALRGWLGPGAIVGGAIALACPSVAVAAPGPAQVGPKQVEAEPESDLEPDAAEAKAKEPVPSVPGPAPAAPAELRHNIRLQARTGLYGSEYGLYTGDTSLQGTYFSGGKAYFAFFNFEGVFVDRRFSHIESELNFSGNPFYARPWLAPFSLTARVTTDWTPFKTLGVGPSINLTNFPFMAFAKKAWVDLFIQYYPLKTDDHLGEQDFMFYWRIPIWRKKIYVRGFARLFIFHADQDRGAYAKGMWGNDLIVELREGFDIYLRHAELVGPRRSGFSVGFRSLLRF